jgi:hypothetical protein
MSWHVSLSGIGNDSPGEQCAALSRASASEPEGEETDRGLVHFLDEGADCGIGIVFGGGGRCCQPRNNENQKEPWHEAHSRFA